MAFARMIRSASGVAMSLIIVRLRAGPRRGSGKAADGVDRVFGNAGKVVD